MFDLLATNDTVRWAFLAALFAIVVFATFIVARMGRERSNIKHAVDSIAQDAGPAKENRLREKRESAWNTLADRIEKTGLSLTDTKADSLRDKMRAAGYESDYAPKLFTLTRIALVVALPAGYFLLSEMLDREHTLISLYGYGAVLAILGLYLPNLYISAKADRRRDEITNGFPDCLDLMLVSVEAGLGLEAAMDRVGREMVSSHPLVATLLQTVTMQLRAGAEREEALRKMGEMSGVDEIRSFATLLIQSDKLGTSVADTLRVYATEMRERRRLRAEERAHRLPVLISIPLVVCMLPTMIGVLMMPGIVRVIRQMLPAFAAAGGG